MQKLIDKMLNSHSLLSAKGETWMLLKGVQI